MNTRKASDLVPSLTESFFLKQVSLTHYTGRAEHPNLRSQSTLNLSFESGEPVEAEKLAISGANELLWMFLIGLTYQPKSLRPFPRLRSRLPRRMFWPDSGRTLEALP